MKTDVNQYKTRLLEYLQSKNVDIDTSKTKPLARCINPSHDDTNPSMTIYDDQYNCNSCGHKGDIFDAAGLLTSAKDFPEKLKEVESVLGVLTSNTSKIAQSKSKKELFIPTVVPLKKVDALKKYTEETVLKLAHFVLNEKDLNPDDEKYRKVHIQEKGWFPYLDKNKLIDLLSIRFEDEKGKKEVLSFYWNGKNVAMKKYPVLLFDRHNLANTKKPVIIHEGEKSIGDAEKKLPEFTHTAWNGGGKKYKNIQDLNILKDKEIFLLPDDDAPGRETMASLQGLLKANHGIESTIIPLFKKARNKKKKGADIEEILQTYSPQEITKTILDLRPKDEDNKQNNRIRNDISNSDVDNSHTFKILGIADDGRAYFLDYENRMLNYELSSLTQNKLIDIAGLQFFKNRYSGEIPKKGDWITEIDALMHISKRIDFDLENCKGRGAWKDNKGNICYHDGKNTIGEFDPDWTFLRKSRRDIGLGSIDCGVGTRKEIMKICQSFNFKTKSDTIRLLSWSVLAPFGGALKWRPAILVTGETGTGKSTVIENIVHPISKYSPASGAESTEPGLRQMLANDSTSVLLDEAENKGVKNKERLKNIFSLMRVSTTANAPPIIKGSTGGKSLSYTVRAMFGFSAINATIDESADDNRITRINFIKKGNFKQYQIDYKKVKKLMTDENCKGIRAFTWRNLEKIIDLGERLESIIQVVTGQNARYAASESILLAANMVVWEDLTYNITDEELTEYAECFYKNQTMEESRDETTEMIERLLDETILIGRNKDRISFRKILVGMKLHLDMKAQTDKEKYSAEHEEKRAAAPDADIYKDYKTTIEHYGLSVHVEKRELAINQNHHEIMKILEIGRGYHRQLERHKSVILSQKDVWMDSTTKKCTVLSGFLNFEEEE